MTVTGKPVPAESPVSAETPAPRKANGGLFRAFWRWHFYASVLVLPILLMLATTGLIYLFRWQIDPLTHPGLMTVDKPRDAVALSIQQQVEAAETSLPDGVVQAVQQGHDERATWVTMAVGEEGEVTRNVYVNPYTGEALGSIDPADLWSNVAIDIHGMLMTGGLSEVELFHDPIVGEVLTLGGVGDRIIELAVCWAIVMALTGYYLYFRGRKARLTLVAKRAKAATLRNRHSTVGALVGFMIIAIVVSGLPWTGLWGSKVQGWASGQGLSLWGEDPGAESTLGDRLEEIGSSNAPAPWAEGASELPESGAEGADSGGAHDHGGAAAPAADGQIPVDRAMTAAEGVGLEGPYYVTYPADDKGVFSVLGDQWHDKANPAYSDVTQERTVHVDQYNGQVVAQYGWDDYTAATKVVSTGIALHEGRRFGSFNLVATTAFCLGIMFLCGTAPLMWWKRRPRGTGSVGAPRGRMPMRGSKVLTAGIVVLGVLLPLFGGSLLLVLLFDRFAVRRSARLQRIFEPA